MLMRTPPSACRLSSMKDDVGRYVDSYGSLTDYLGTRPVQPVADIVQRGLGNRKARRINDLTERQQRSLVNY
jgi:hypothetical protein